MDNLMKERPRALTVLTAFLALATLMTACRKSGVENTSIEEAGYAFHSLGAFSITGGDTEAAGLSGFQRDSFHSYFVSAAREILLAHNLEESVDYPDIIIRYTLGETLIVTALDAETRRLVWRGESRDTFDARSLTRDSVKTLVRQALERFPQN